MNITLDKNLITSKFLSSISKISEECSIIINSNYIHTLVSDLANSVILYCKINTDTDIQEEQTLHIKDVRKLSKVFDCIKEDRINIKVDDNANILRYKSPALSFKLHLVNEQVIRKAGISLHKINQIEFDSEFTLTGSKLSEILKGSIFSTETDKIYFYTKDGSVYAELTDKASDDVDSITFEVTNEYSGNKIKKPLPFSLETLRLLNSSKDTNITVKINNSYNLLMFEIITTESENKYIVPAFTK